MNADIADIDRWIQLLMTCKQLPENDVKKLCEKVLQVSLSPCPRNPLRPLSEREREQPAGEKEGKSVK